MYADIQMDQLQNKPTRASELMQHLDSVHVLPGLSALGENCRGPFSLTSHHGKWTSTERQQMVLTVAMA